MQRSSSRPLASLGVFLGSSDGNDPALVECAYEVGAQLAEREIELVYGGGGGGLMGALSRGALDHGGRVCGVIPTFMVDREWGRGDEPGLEMHVVGTMHERKAMMTARSDAFLVLPGGLGTLEEMFEVWTWQTLGLHAKPLGVLNPDGFWDPLVAMLDQVAEAGFMRRSLVGGPRRRRRPGGGPRRPRRADRGRAPSAPMSSGGGPGRQGCHHRPYGGIHAQRRRLHAALAGRGRRVA